MKTKLFFISTFWISMLCFSQNTYVPDDNFEQALINLGYDTAPLDDYVPTANINTVASLNIIDMNISDLTGIEDFTALTHLYCYENNLSTLDVSLNTALTWLDCSSTNLISLDLSQNNMLTVFYCYDTQLTSLNFKNGNNENINDFYAKVNPNLECIDVDNPSWFEANWSWAVDEGVVFSIHCDVANTTYIPDDNFEQALIDLGYDTAPLDNLVPLANIITITDLDIHSKNIADLTGIEYFTTLTYLDCSSNNLNSLDVSQNTALTTLYCSNNNLSSLNVKNGNNVNFENFNATNNPNLDCINVDDVAWSTTNWYNSVDDGIVFALHCGETYVPDDNFEQALIDLGFDTPPLDDYVPTANINTVTVLDVQWNNISDLTGIEDFTALTYLNCFYNNLSTLDVSQNTALTILNCRSNNLSTLVVSQNTALTTLHCGYNNLSTLNVSQNTALNTLYCQPNNLTNLDLSQNTALTTLECGRNNLSSLNVKNGNNVNFEYFNATNNPNLDCIDVDDVAYSDANWTGIDSGTSFSEDCIAFLSTDEFEKSVFTMYPNPASELLNIRLNQDANYSIMNINGQVYKKGKLTNKENTIDVSSLPSGLFFIKVKTDKGVVTKKLVKH